MAAVVTNRGRIGFVERGSGAGTPIIFLHGVGSDKSVWRPQLDHFAATRRTLAFDYPGYGESDFAEGATRDDFAAAILAAMDALEIEDAHVCGLSLGGVVAIAMHAAAPDRCASLIIADSFAAHPDGQAIFERSIAASHNGMRVLAEARVGALLASKEPRIRNEVIGTMARIDAAVADAYGWPVDLAEEEVLARLVALNRERAKEEKRGLVRWLRPDYQSPRFGSEKEKEEQLEADLGEAILAAVSGPKPGFPSDERDQTPAVLHQLMEAEGLVDAETIAAAFRQGRKSLPAVQAVLASLYRMGLVSSSDGKRFAYRRAA